MNCRPRYTMQVVMDPISNYQLCNSPVAEKSGASMDSYTPTFWFGRIDLSIYKFIKSFIWCLR
jgi:hypothetical protein